MSTLTLAYIAGGCVLLFITYLWGWFHGFDHAQTPAGVAMAIRFEADRQKARDAARAKRVDEQDKRQGLRDKIRNVDNT